MRINIQRVFLAASVLLGVSNPPVSSADAVPYVQANPIQSDARLNDVQFVGSRFGWIVGDHGVVWRTVDGGNRWTLVPTPVDCNLQSVSFLTDRVGWIVGGGTRSYGGLPYGVVLSTTDAGASWRVLSGQSPQVANSETTDSGLGEFLPRLKSVRFFNLKQGIIVGENSTSVATGVLSTEDGGQTWQTIQFDNTPTDTGHGFTAAAFGQFGDGNANGVVVGQRGRTAIIGGGQLRETSFGLTGLRGFTDVALQPNDHGWLVGDGGLIRHTTTGGVVWKSPPQSPPVRISDFCDFKTVAARGDKVWVAGDPGGMIFHSDDAGQSWQIQKTGQTLPIRRIRFRNETDGWAVGEMGVILRTSDSGHTWQTIRGAGHRAAMLGFFSSKKRLSLSLLAEQSAELGHRCVMVLPARRDLGQDGFDQSDLNVRLHETTIRLGGSSGQLDWRFPISAPGIERNQAALMADWNRQTEGRFVEIILSRLVCQIRTWRPDVVVLDNSLADDMASRVLNQAVTQAIADAGDPLKYSLHQSFADLEPWSVKRVFTRQPIGSQAGITIDPHQYLPRMQQPTGVLVRRVNGILGSRVPVQTESFRMTYPADEKSAHHLFAGLGISPGSDARRAMLPLDELLLENGQKLAAQQRNVESWAAINFKDSKKADQAIAQIRSTIREMSPEQSAALMTALADICRENQNLDQAEQILMELVALFPDQAAAADALQWLMVRMGSEELNWQRSQQLSVQKDSSRDPSVMKRAIQQSGGLSTDRTLVRQAGGMTVQKGFGAAAQDARQIAADDALQQAARFSNLMRARWPDLADRVGTQFAMASMLRGVGSSGAARGLTGQLAQTPGLWGQTALAELWLQTGNGVCPTPHTMCKIARQRPHLDAVLSDDVWQTALELRLGLTTEDREDKQKSPALVMMAHDNRYLYLAGSVPRNGTAPLDSAQMKGRTHDADLTEFDRITIRLDTDRDYSTWYTLEIDQRGWTRDSCHDSTDWNPKWFVAADGDERRWRFEAAIPLNELVSRKPLPNTTWAIGVTRTIPAVRSESWTSPVSSRPRPDAFGLMKFE